MTATSKILSDFVTEKIATYKAPDREGVSRGEPIGFSKDKYAAALLSSLTALSVKELAKSLDSTSYGVIRKWQTEDDFKEAKVAHRREFNIFFWNRIRNNAEKHLAKWLAGDEAQLEAYDFEDGYGYGGALCQLLCRQAERIAGEAQWHQNTEHLVLMLESWRALSALREKHLASFVRTSGRPKSEAVPPPEADDLPLLRTAEGESEAKPAFERAIRLLETAILEAALKLIESHNRGSASKVGLQVMEILVKERKTYDERELRVVEKASGIKAKHRKRGWQQIL